MWRSKIAGAVLLGLLPICAAAQEFEDIHACDEYAAHPNDPYRWAKGVADSDIIPGPAVKFCRDAVAEHDQTPRFRFQLGRALWAANRPEEGVDVFLTLSDTFDYGPVYAYLADAYLYGIGGVEVDEEMAVTLYQIAFEDGFAPAGEVLAAIAGDVDEAAPEVAQEQVALAAPVEPESPADFVPQEPQVREVKFNPRSYLEGKLLSGLHSGNMDDVRLGKPKYYDVDKSFFYLNGFLKPFQQNLNFRDSDCIYLANPTLVRILNTKVLQSVPGVGGLMVGNGRSLEQNLNDGAAMGFQMMGEMLQGMNNGQGMLGNDVSRSAIETSILAEHGEKDGNRLISQHSCGSATTKRIMANLTAYVTGRGTITVSAEEKQRRAAEKEKKAERAEADRQKQLRVSARKSCVAQFKKADYCGCLITNLDNQNIKEAEWKKLQANFREVVAIGKAYPEFAGQLRSCRTQGG